jgi:hypothetical protein
LPEIPHSVPLVQGGELRNPGRNSSGFFPFSCHPPRTDALSVAERYRHFLNLIRAAAIPPPSPFGAALRHLQFTRGRGMSGKSKETLFVAILSEPQLLTLPLAAWVSLFSSADRSTRVPQDHRLPVFKGGYRIKWLTIAPTPTATIAILSADARRRFGSNSLTATYSTAATKHYDV